MDIENKFEKSNKVTFLFIIQRLKNFKRAYLNKLLNNSLLVIAFISMCDFTIIPPVVEIVIPISIVSLEIWVIVFVELFISLV